MIQVLIVEDSPVQGQFMRGVLDSDPEIEVMAVAESAEAAFAVMDISLPDLITMDLHLPGKDGYEATRHIMETSPVPIVVVTASVDCKQIKEVLKAIDSGAVACLQKPRIPLNGKPGPDCEKLVKTVKEMAGLKVGYRQAGAW